MRAPHMYTYIYIYYHILHIYIYIYIPFKVLRTANVSNPRRTTLASNPKLFSKPLEKPSQSALKPYNVSPEP